MIERLKGQYTYGELYSDDLRGKSVPFEIEWALEDGIIKGTCVDEEGKKVFDEPATIHGFIDNGIISFIKQYPKYWEVDENGVISVLDKPASPEIHYSGIVVNGGFEGDWGMTVTYKSENGNIAQYRCTGTWTLAISLPG